MQTSENPSPHRYVVEKGLVNQHKSARHSVDIECCVLDHNIATTFRQHSKIVEHKNRQDGGKKKKKNAAWSEAAVEEERYCSTAFCIYCLSSSR